MFHNEPMFSIPGENLIQIFNFISRTFAIAVGDLHPISADRLEIPDDETKDIVRSIYPDRSYDGKHAVGYRFVSNKPEVGIIQIIYVYGAEKVKVKYKDNIRITTDTFYRIDIVVDITDKMISGYDDARYLAAYKIFSVILELYQPWYPLVLNNLRDKLFSKLCSIIDNTAKTFAILTGCLTIDFKPEEIAVEDAARNVMISEFYSMDNRYGTNLRYQPENYKENVLKFIMSFFE